jgi:hypothetical protein
MSVRISCRNVARSMAQEAARNIAQNRLKRAAGAHVVCQKGAATGTDPKTADNVPAI